MPQSMPARFDVTVPAPLPDFVAVSAYELSVNVAVTVFAIVIVTVHDAVPLQPAPDHPVNVEPAPGALCTSTWPPSSDVSRRTM